MIKHGDGIQKLKMLIYEVDLLLKLFSFHFLLFLALYQLAVMCFEGVAPKEFTLVK
jgi:hypothetical protein